MSKSGLAGVVIKSIPVVVMVVAFAIPFNAMGADRTVLGELFTIPG